MKLKSILSITFALVFVVAFIAPSVSAWWIFGDKTTGNASAVMGMNNEVKGIPDPCNVSFSTIEKCGNITENIIFKSPVNFSKAIYGENIFAKSMIIARSEADDIYTIIASRNTGLSITSYLPDSQNQITISNKASPTNIYDYIIGVTDNDAFQISRDINNYSESIFKYNPSNDVTTFGSSLVVNKNFIVDQNSSINVVGLSGQGNAYACLTADGTLYRSNTPCN